MLCGGSGGSAAQNKWQGSRSTCTLRYNQLLYTLLERSHTTCTMLSRQDRAETALERSLATLGMTDCICLFHALIQCHKALQPQDRHENHTGTHWRPARSLGTSPRVDALLDPGSFIELNAFAVHRVSAFGMERRTPLGTVQLTVAGLPVRAGFHRVQRLTVRGIRRENLQTK